METIDIKRKIFSKEDFSTVVDIEFSQLIPKLKITGPLASEQISQFFDTYNSIFYDIPTTGPLHTHLEIVNRSSDYLGISYQDLLEELRVTRNENTSLKNQLLVLTGI